MSRRTGCCAYSFATNQSNCSGDNPQPYVNVQHQPQIDLGDGTCGKIFRKWHNLFDHLRTHTGERPFVCPVANCSDSFKQYSNQLKHLNTHKGQNPLPCKICGTPYPRSQILDHFTNDHKPQKAKQSIDSDQDSDSENNSRGQQGKRLKLQ
ncbi:hypothetical protein FGO68_gene11531 [Halteria grandinella]|uniref:C2H2-type domain-containing protein n=1 Tax=Halteria grandinella TaxID=5974 RepID=A0A8J8P3H0_HALGN|nr:hypothetical protein FGO68_gene11531 [Halteria grandinella]